MIAIPFAVLLLAVRFVVTRRSSAARRQLFTPGEVDGSSLPRRVRRTGPCDARDRIRHRDTRRHAAVVRAERAPVGVLRRRRHRRRWSECDETGARSPRATRQSPARARDPARLERAVAGVLIPLVALISWGWDPLAFLVPPGRASGAGVAAAVPALVLPRRPEQTRNGGTILLAVYTLLAVAFYFAGDR